MHSAHATHCEWRETTKLKLKWKWKRKVKVQIPTKIITNDTNAKSHNK